MLAKLPRPLLRLFQRGAHFWFRLARPLTMGVRAVALDEFGRVFLVRHSYLPGWHLPGGGVEVGETALEALTRELREEGHLELASPPVLLGVYLNVFLTKRDHVLVYVARDIRQTHARPADREIVETGFFPVDKLPDGVARASRARIAEALAGAPLSALW
jgi:ADP-ribose pyrophosphatase YjhB (NUDIX family)